MIRRTIERSADLASAADSFLTELGGWIGQCVGSLEGQGPTDGHDQGTFTTCWGPYVTARGDAGGLEFMKLLRDQSAEHFATTGKWRHGYWRRHEAHHGTEHFELFLGALWRLDGNDQETRRQLIDAAEHMGNWVDEIPPWFDWETGCFRSLYFGTDGVDDDGGMRINVPDHFRCVSICLLAFDMTANRRYLDLARCHGGLWADAICSMGRIPAAIGPDGGLDELPSGADKAYRRFAGQVSSLGDEVNLAENLLASAAPDVLVRLWQLTAEERFVEAARRLLDVLADQLGDPDAGCGAEALRQYRLATGDSRYDQAVLDACDQVDAYAFDSLAIEPEVSRAARPHGIGKRTDMPQWFEDSVPRAVNPILLSLAGEITGDRRMATRALDLGKTCFQLAREVYRSGRDHGCSARSVSAVARGHGRENNAGVVTACLWPTMLAFDLVE